ncbi:hypothetical protein [Amycolatopsis sp. NPDC054798]
MRPRPSARAPLAVGIRAREHPARAAELAGLDQLEADWETRKQDFFESWLEHETRKRERHELAKEIARELDKPRRRPWNY